MPYIEHSSQSVGGRPYQNEDDGTVKGIPNLLPKTPFLVEFGLGSAAGYDGSSTKLQECGEGLL